MEHSPAGRTIETLEGDAETITRRGQRIGSIGNQMIASANVLQQLADDGGEQRGKAIDKIREIVGDTYEELRRAGEMYQPTGPVLVHYGNAVADAQPLIRAAVDACEDAWQRYHSAPGQTGERLFPALTEEMQEQDAEDDERKRQLYDEFLSEARTFDGHVDTWENAFDAAVDGIGDVLDGSIEDGFWDNVDGVVEVVLQVLSVVAIIVAIAGIIIGGPLFALIGAIVGIATLLLTAYQVLRDDAGMDKLIIAAVGIIPFGKVGLLFKGKPGLLTFAGETFTAFRPSSWSAASGQLANISTVARTSGGGAIGFLKGLGNTWAQENPTILGDIMTRFMFGKNTTKFTELAAAIGDNVGWQKAAASWEFAYTTISGSWKAVDNIVTWTGNADQKPSKMFPWVGALL
ncbi:hypothetical protein ACIQLK_11775 [Microbacterium sp. NPDC091382]|uniref:hypothetical protein n=1 Tax=Microbacterium sp. NPDC091382 TaxID=3364210 RepID=UPI00381291CF